MVPWYDFDDDIILMTCMVPWYWIWYWWCHDVAYWYIYTFYMRWWYDMIKWFYDDGYVVLWVFMDGLR